MATPHARTSDIPGWTCPPQIRDIPHSEDSWGRVYVADNPTSNVVQDEQGYLWAHGNVTPSRSLDLDARSAVLCWTEQGLGIYVGPSVRGIYVIPRERLDAKMEWMPIAVVLPDLPTHVKDA